MRIGYQLSSGRRADAFAWEQQFQCSGNPLDPDTIIRGLTPDTLPTKSGSLRSL